MPGTFDSNSRVFVTGHRGLVGSALVRALKERGGAEILTAGREELDLREPAAVERWFGENRPEFVLHAAGVVGGIEANRSRPVDFLRDNALMALSVLDAAHKHEVRKLLYLGSSCIYPRECPQPIQEEYLLSGPLEPTNEAYAVAKIAGVKLCGAYRRQYGRNFIAAMPTNLYGPGDNFDLKGGHVLPALIRRFHEAKLAGESEVVVWGSGRPRREFLHVDDLAEACLFLMDRYDGASPVNVGSGEETTIAQLAELVRETVHPEGRIVFDRSKPDGTPRKRLDSGCLRALGWRPRRILRDGVRETYRWFLEHRAEARGAREQSLGA